MVNVTGMVADAEKVTVVETQTRAQANLSTADAIRIVMLTAKTFA